MRLVLEYDGGEFCGWQRQRGRRSVEAELCAALESLTGEPSLVCAAGRTDAGAHAEGQVVNFRYRGRLPLARLGSALNALLPPDLCVLSAEAVDPHFHARHLALRRVYRYSWCDRPARAVLGRERLFQVWRRLSEEAMAEAALALVGEHDWTTFCRARGSDGASPRARVRPIMAAELARTGDRVDLQLTGLGFLRGLIRGLAGELTEIGLGRREPGDLGRLIAARDRRLAPKPAPARGLTLVRVEYA
ncbi:MAG TPA: tRNA pseudouridine(38-40) synthase TruA [Candidatus Nitrosotalea sp.]|nr:tRNA pseudouridine(38-40) synthase TruA [Candidatus Nitrosotalea sp.]